MLELQNYHTYFLCHRLFCKQQLFILDSTDGSCSAQLRSGACHILTQGHSSQSYQLCHSPGHLRTVVTT